VKYIIDKDEVQMNQVVQYVSEKNSVLSKTKESQHKKLINYFQQRISDFKDEDFVSS